jgi:ketosteroid isomerase-like protein
MAERPPPNERLVRATFEAYVNEGPEVVVPLLDPDVEVYSPPNLANSGTFHGVDGYLEWIRAWFDAWDDFEIDPQEIAPIGEDCVVAVCRQRGTGRSSGIAVEQTMVYMWQFRDGKIVRFHLYLDRDQAVAAALRTSGGEGASSSS